MTIDVGQLITWIVVGAIAGWLASIVMTGHRFSTLTHIILGLIGAFVGGILFTLFKIQVPPSLAAIKFTIGLADIIVAFVGAIVVLLIAFLIYRRRV